MRLPIVSPDKFAAQFNQVVPGAYRKISAQDVRDITGCGLIGKYQYYGRADLETVRAVLQYEQLRQKRIQGQSTEDKSEPLKCKRCGQPLPYQQEAKKGRPKEYCSGCELSRARERYRKWKARRKPKQKVKQKLRPCII